MDFAKQCLSHTDFFVSERARNAAEA